MTVQYYLQENNLPNGDQSYSARVKHARVIDLEGLLDLMDFCGLGLTKGLMRMLVEELTKAMLLALLNGWKIITPFGVFSVSIKGRFKSMDDRIDPKRNPIELTLKPNEQFQTLFIQQVQPRKIKTRLPAPKPETYQNLADSSVPNLLTPGRMARITGQHLKFDPADPEQGIFLIPVKNGSPLEPAGPPIRVEEIGRNKKREQIFLVPPDLPPGTYLLEVRAVFGRHSLRTGQLRRVLIVP